MPVIPVNLLQTEAHDLVGTEDESEERQKNGVIPLADNAS